MLQIIYRPLATMALVICLVINVLLILFTGYLMVGLAMMPAIDVRNLGLVVTGLVWAYLVWMLVEATREIPKFFQEIWRLHA